MQQIFLDEIRTHISRNKYKQIFRKFVQFLCCVVVFCTTYALILPAITMEQTAYCGLEEHTHSEECYQELPHQELVCNEDTLQLHNHSESCYDSDANLICGLADYVVHTHEKTCFYDGLLVCTLPERGVHVHNDACYIPGETEPEVLHVHTDSCSTQQQGELLCTIEEYEGHAHDAACYAAGDTLECTLAENHVHMENCHVYPLLCTLSTEPHIHSESCYGTGELLCNTLEHHVHGDGCIISSQICENVEEGHEHSDSCYATEIVCTIPENHSHGSSCYKSVIICGKAEGEHHEHGGDCYSTEPQLNCSLAENHFHDDSCYLQELVCTIPEDPGHSHGEDCYQWETVLVCGLEEGQPEPTEPAEPILNCTEPVAQEHVHGENCFVTVGAEPTPKCGITEEDHIHTEDCYVCTIEEHTHTLACYSDPEADVESAAVWESTFAHVALTGDWPTDVVAIAETQIGYTESSRNYEVWEDNSIHGYTRYGDWYGSPHGDWCAMFVSFCLNYAEVEGMPLHWGVRPWIEQLSGLGLYHGADGYLPKSGDLIFFDWEGDGLSDHVGIVADVQKAQEHTGGSIKTIEGNSSNCVQYVHYTLNDPVILGYSELPAAEVPEEELPVITKEVEIYSDSNYEQLSEDPTIITVTGAIPEDAQVRAYPVTQESELDILCAYDISIMLPDGSVFEQAEGKSLTVCIQNSNFLDLSEETSVYFMPADGEPVRINTSISQDVVSFETDHFSVYAVVLPAKTISKTAVIYTDSSYEMLADDSTQIILTGKLPEEAEVYAYPATVESELDILCAYDITIFLPDGSVFEPEEGELVNVSIQSSVLEAADADLKVYHILDEGQPDPVEVQVSEGSVSFEASHFSVYIVTRDAGFSVSFDPAISATYEEKDYTSSKYDTFCALKFAVNDNYWGSVTVTITSSAFADNQNAIVYEVTEWGESQIASTVSADSISFTVGGWEFRTHTYAVLFPPTSISSMTLTEDLVVTEKMFVSEDVTIDLNGFSIRTADDYSGDAIFDVTEGGSLTILDSQEGTSGTSGETVTYTVTYSNVSNSANGSTTETETEYTVTAAGAIYAGSIPVIKASGGTVNIQSGMIYGGTGRAIEASNGSSINLTGGYLCGFSHEDRGGAIYISGGSLNISDDAVIAGNHAANFGGGIYASGCTITMDGGNIACNTVSDSTTNTGFSGSGHGWIVGGAGLAADNCTVNLSGGYITNNSCLATGYWGGGGGILALGGTSVNMSGGFITGNTANAGGGVKTEDFDGNARFTMTGGYVCSNLATYSEGGGISIGAYDNGYVKAGYINNNQTNGQEDWGGGGLFVANDANLYIQDALITDNTAGGFGAGVAGCSTARMHISINHGAAVHGNYAAGQHTSGKNSTKNEDWIYAKNSAVFMSNGYNDVFSALNCTVEGGILGGGPANWSGSCDGMPVSSNSTEAFIQSEYVLGLTSKPSAADWAAAQNYARLYINGNSSYTHGGGILCNGYLVMGTPERMVVGARIEVAAEKQYLNDQNEAIEMTDNQFTFVIAQVNADGSHSVVSTGTNNTNGVITFDGRLPFSNEGIYTYEIYERAGATPGIHYDQTRYRMTVVVSSGEISNPATNVTTYQCYVDSIQVDRWNADTDSWDSYLEAFNPDDSDKRAIHLDLGSNTFVNRAGETDGNTAVSVTKIWDCPENSILDSVAVTLLQNEVPYASEEALVILSEENNWSATWSELPLADESGQAYTYSVVEEALPEFDAEYASELNATDNSLQFTITNTQKVYGLELSKVSNHPTPVPLEGAVFRISDSTGQYMTFLYKEDTGAYILSDEENAVFDLVTNADGKLLVTKELPAGTYILEEIEAPYGYKLAAPVTVTLGAESLTENGILSITVVDELIEYVLPETGGSGTHLYTSGGMLLSAAAWILLYSNMSKRRKEEVRSS